jgi:DNA-binding MarR family transcriptional regulator
MGRSKRTNDPVGVIEIELMRLVRYLETFGRQSALYDRVDRAGYMALRTLDSLGPSSSRALAAALHLDASTVTRQVATLRRAGLIDRRPHPVDRRSSTLAVTDQGLEAMRSIERERRRKIQVLVGRWNATERGELARALANLNDSLVDAVTPTEDLDIGLTR